VNGTYMLAHSRRSDIKTRCMNLTLQKKAYILLSNHTVVVEWSLMHLLRT